MYCLQEESDKFVYSEAMVDKTSNYMDRWILSFTQSLLKFVKEEMAGKVRVQSHVIHNSIRNIYDIQMLCSLQYLWIWDIEIYIWFVM